MRRKIVGREKDEDIFNTAWHLIKNPLHAVAQEMMSATKHLRDIIHRTYTVNIHARAMNCGANFITHRKPDGQLTVADPRVIKSHAEFLAYNDNLVNKMTPEQTIKYLAIALEVDSGTLQMVDAEVMFGMQAEAFFFDKNGRPVVMHA